MKTVGVRLTDSQVQMLEDLKAWTREMAPALVVTDSHVIRVLIHEEAEKLICKGDRELFNRKYNLLK